MKKKCVDQLRSVVTTIGIGLDEDKVRAGEIFLRIYKK